MSDKKRTAMLNAMLGLFFASISAAMLAGPFGAILVVSVFVAAMSAVEYWREE